ncbi:MAG: tetratricopeptide repeat protein [Candidatus Methylomirabilales bacterium]
MIKRPFFGGLALLVVFALLWPSLAWTRKASLLDPLKEPILKGIDRLMNRDLEAAEALFKNLEGQDQTGVIVPLLLSYVQLARIEEKEDPDEDLDRYRALMAAVVEKVEGALAKAPQDPDLLFLAGMAFGQKGIADGAAKHYLAAYRGIKKAIRLFEEALKLDPEAYDAYYGLGLYHYAFSRLPGFYRTLASIILPAGDREQGLRELRLAAEKGIYTKMLAKVALLRIYGTPEESYEAALPLAEELIRRYPGSPELYFHLALIYSELGRHPEALRIAEEIRGNIEREENHFTKVMLPRYWQLMGKIFMDRDDFSQAIACFKKAIENGNKRYRWAVAWAWTRTGMIYDLLGQREEARKHYRMALKVETNSIALDYAKRYLSEPYRREEKKRQGG